MFQQFCGREKGPTGGPRRTTDIPWKRGFCDASLCESNGDRNFRNADFRARIFRDGPPDIGDRNYRPVQRQRRNELIALLCMAASSKFYSSELGKQTSRLYCGPAFRFRKLVQICSHSSPPVDTWLPVLPSRHGIGASWCQQCQRTTDCCETMPSLAVATLPCRPVSDSRAGSVKFGPSCFWRPEE